MVKFNVEADGPEKIIHENRRIRKKSFLLIISTVGA